jgi:glycosyltransferase involved in cell wall biosynthesis
VLEKILANTSETNIQIVHVKENQGYGFGIVSGLKECRGSVIGWTHADLQTDPHDFIKAISIFKKLDYPLNSFVKGDRVNRHFKDVFFTRGMSFFQWLVLRTRMWDINAQPTVFPKSFFTSLQDVPNDFSLDLFIYYSAINSGMSIKRFPVNFESRLTGKGHNDLFLSKLKYSYKTIMYSIKLRGQLKKISKYD